MNAQEILATLKKLGKPQTATIYRRLRSERFGQTHHDFPPSYGKESP